MLNFILLQASAAVDTLSLAQNTQGKPTMNVFDMAVKGGWIMIPILLLSFIAVFIFIDRYRVIKKAEKVDHSLMDNVKATILKGQIDTAVALTKSQNTPIARMIEKGITRIGRPMADINTAIEMVGNLEISKLEKGLPILASVAGGAPMIGFLGTVTGMVRAFFNMASAGNSVDINILSAGIYEAMVTTIAGLIVGIIAYFAYNYLVARIENIVFNMEAATSEFLDLLNEPAKKL